MEKVIVDIHSVIDDEVALEELNGLKKEIDGLTLTIEHSEEIILSIEDRISLEQTIVASEEEITPEMVSISLLSNQTMFDSLGYSYDSSKIASMENHKDALVASTEAKVLGLKDMASMFKNIYDKLIILIKKLYVKALVFMNNIKDRSDKLTEHLLNNRVEASATIKIEGKLNDTLVNKYGAILYGFSGAKIDTKFVKNYLEDLSSTKTMSDHRIQVFRIIDRLGKIRPYINETNFSLPIEDKILDIVKEAYEMDNGVVSNPFRYSGTKYKCLSIEKFNPPKKGAKYLDLYQALIGIRVLVVNKEIDKKVIDGKFKDVKYDDLVEMVKLVSKDTDEIKALNKSISDEAEQVLKSIDTINFSGNKDEDKILKLFVPATRYARTVMSTISVDKMIGQINGLKDVMNMVNIISKSAIKTAGGAQPIEGQFLLPNIK